MFVDGECHASEYGAAKGKQDSVIVEAVDVPPAPTTTWATTPAPTTTQPEAVTTTSTTIEVDVPLTPAPTTTAPAPTPPTGPAPSPDVELFTATSLAQTLPVTGVDSITMLWAVGALMAAGAILIGAQACRNRNQKDNPGE